MSRAWWSGRALLGLCAAGVGVALPPDSALAQERQSREVRAIRLTAPLQLDGRLDEEVYSRVAPAGDFVQQVPDTGQPATEPTEVWVLFDDDAVYVSLRAIDSHPERIIANELRRDSTISST